MYKLNLLTLKYTEQVDKEVENIFTRGKFHQLRTASGTWILFLFLPFHYYYSFRFKLSVILILKIYFI